MPRFRLRLRAAAFVFAACALAMGSTPLRGQQAQDPLLTRGDAAMAALQPAAALARYDSVLAKNATHHGALWRASLAESELAEFDEDASRRGERYRRAEARARAAVRLDSTSLDSRYALARVLGQQARVVTDLMRRATLGRETWEQATACLGLAPRHPGCLHVLGVWHAQVSELSPLMRRMAVRMGESSAFERASWSEAERLLGEAIAVDPHRVAHRLELARVYSSQKKVAQARAQFAAAERGEIMDSGDPHRKQLAVSERRRLPDAR